MQQLDYNRIPQHVAIIMDGNGRWAKAKGLPRTAGHVEGVSTVKKVTEEAARLGVNNHTYYCKVRPNVRNVHILCCSFLFCQ